MDGVIVDSEPVHFEIETSVMSELGISISEKEYHAFVGRTAKSMWSELIERFGLPIAVDEAIQKSKDQYHYRLYHTDQPLAIAGTIALIKGLHAMGKKLVLASSSTLENINIVINKHQLTQYFDHIVGGDEVVNGKPDPEIFNTAAKRAKTLPSQCLVIEDSRNGVAAAKAAGMRCIGFNNPSSPGQLLYDADLVISDMSILSAHNIFDLLQKTKSSS
jgi:HAD superfamily hydrolase (TIGR01509 family)